MLNSIPDIFDSHETLIICNHNLALCNQKFNLLRLGNLEMASHYLKESLRLFKQFVFNLPSSEKIKSFKYTSKSHLQLCALLSQMGQHAEALSHSKISITYSHSIIYEIIELLKRLIIQDNISMFRKRSKESDKAFSQIASKLLPIFLELETKLVDLSNIDNSPENKRRYNTLDPKAKRLKIRSYKNEIDIRNLFGFFPQTDWLSLNIGAIMQITPLTINDLLSKVPNKFELLRESLLDCISVLSTAYFSISTEKRFLASSKDENDINFKISDFFHSKSLEITSYFLPADCPLYSHFLTSYQKHHAFIKQVIVI